MFDFIKNYSLSLMPISTLMEAATPIGTVRFMKGQFGMLNQVKVKVTNAGDDGHNLRHGGWVYWMSVSQATGLGIKDGEVVPVKGVRPISPEEYLRWKADNAKLAFTSPVALPPDAEKPVDLGGLSADLPASTPVDVTKEPVSSECADDRRLDALLKSLSVGQDASFKGVLEALIGADSAGMALWEIKNLLLTLGFGPDLANPVRKRLLNYLAQQGFGHFSADNSKFVLDGDWYFLNKSFWDSEFQSAPPLSSDYDELKDPEVERYLQLIGMPTEKSAAFYVALFKNAGNFGISLQKAEIQAIAGRKFVLGDYSLEKVVQAMRERGLLVLDPDTELYYFRPFEAKDPVDAPTEVVSDSISAPSLYVDAPEEPIWVETEEKSDSEPSLEQNEPENSNNAVESFNAPSVVSAVYVPIAQEQIGTLRFYPNTRGGELTHVGVLATPGKYKYIMTVKKAESLGLMHGDVIEFDMPVEGKPVPKYGEDGKVLKKLVERSG